MSSHVGEFGRDSPMMDVERNARAQVVYRHVNDRIRELDEAFRDRGRIEVMCECGRGCAERIEVPMGEYDRVRRESTYFLVTAPHFAGEVDRVIEDHGSWLLVEAIGVAAEIARTGMTP
jgi:hypothetical protein